MDRVTSASAGALLERAAPAIAAGSVNVMSVAAIRQRSRERWPRTRPQVEDFIERAFRRLASPRDVVVALNDLEFLTIQADSSRAAALNVTANLLKDTLTFFLGAAEPEDLKLMVVTGFEAGEIAVQPVDLATFNVAPPLPSSPTGPAAPPAERLEWQATRRDWELASEDGQQYQLSISVEPIWNVGSQVVTSFFLRDAVEVADGEGRRPLGTGRLPATVAGAAALQTVEHAAQLLTGPNALSAALHVPIALEALSYSNARYRLLHALKGLPDGATRRLILEITNLPNGFPQGRMLDLVATLSPYSRAILARAPSDAANLEGWRRCGLGGVTLDCAALDPADRHVHGRLAVFAAAALRAAPACVAYTLGSRSLLVSAWAAGFTHIGGAAVQANVGVITAQRLIPEQLYPESDRRGAA